MKSTYELALVIDGSLEEDAKAAALEQSLPGNPSLAKAKSSADSGKPSADRITIYGRSS